MFKIEPFETPETAVKRIAVERLDLITSLLTDPMASIDKAIHTSRKSLKRIRAVLRLIRDEIGDETYRAENICYREAGRRLAPLRDSAVMVIALDTICQQIMQPSAFTATRDLLISRQERIHQQFLANTNTLADLVAAIEAGRERFLALPVTHTSFNAFAGGLCRIYRQGRRLMTAAFNDPAANPALFHDWRKRVKYLMYHLEFLEPLWPPVLRAWGQDLQYISDLLGEAHDLVVLGQVIQTDIDQTAVKNEINELLPLIHTRRRELEEMARPYGRRLFAESPAAFTNRLGVLWQVWQTTGIGGRPLSLIPADLVDVRQAAELLGLSTRQIRQQIYDGRLPALKVGRIWVIPRTAVTMQT